MEADTWNKANRERNQREIDRSLKIQKIVQMLPESKREEVLGTLESLLGEAFRDGMDEATFGRGY